jgi:hypothetical protein
MASDLSLESPLPAPLASHMLAQVQHSPRVREQVDAGETSEVGGETVCRAGKKQVRRDWAKGCRGRAERPTARCVLLAVQRPTSFAFVCRSQRMSGCFAGKPKGPGRISTVSTPWIWCVLIIGNSRGSTRTSAARSPVRYSWATSSSPFLLSLRPTSMMKVG